MIQTLSSKYLKIVANCYLVRVDTVFFLIDTGISRSRNALVKDLEAAGCRPGALKLIILTHGDLDHSGNCAYLRRRYGAPIAMHAGDRINVERGDMFANKRVNPLPRAIARLLFFIIGLGRFETFTPDLFLEDGQDLTGYGWEATAIHLPGHSRGSIGILTADGDLFCGDMLENIQKPAVNTLVDDPKRMRASTEKLKRLEIKMVYPGHGKPFRPYWEHEQQCGR